MHEAKITMETVRRDYTSVGTLTAPMASAALTACEQAVCGLYRAATGSDFPYQHFPRHKPGIWVNSLSLFPHLSPDVQKFVSRIDGFSLDKLRFESEAAFQQYTSPSATKRGAEIVAGTIRLVEDASALVSNAAALSAIRAAAAKL
jgi:hypothetical protein